MFPNSSTQSSGNRIDVTTLAPFGNEITTFGVAGLTAVLSVTGKGFVDSYYAITSGALGTGVIKMTVDGVVKMLLINGAASVPFGLTNKADYYPTSTAGNLNVRNPGQQTVPTFVGTTVRPYPTTDGTAGLMVLGNAPVYFYSSLLLELSNSSGTLSYRYSGAFK